MNSPPEPKLTRRLTLVIHSLEGGGAERVLAGMANHWAAAGDVVTLITLADTDQDAYQVSSAVRRLGLNVMRHSSNPLTAMWNNLGRVKKLRRAVQQSRPDHVISFTDKINVLTLVATWGISVPVIICDRVDPRRHPMGRVWSLLRRLTYRRCQSAVVQTAAVRDFLLPLVRAKPVYVIPNSVPERDTEVHADTSPETVIAMGRLEWQKGFDLLIDAFARVSDRHPSWRLKILGEGRERPKLARFVQQRNLADRVELAGWTAAPWAELRESGLFVLSSRYEGFPNALLEAMACGLPAICFDCDSGPAEIVRHEIDGLLVPPEDTAALSAALERLMSSRTLRQQFGKRAREVADRFGNELFFLRWEAVLAQADADREPFPSAHPTERG